MVALRGLAGIFLLLAIAFLFGVSARMKAETAPGTGIEGSVRISPTHGGPVKEGEPDSAPLSNAAIIIEGATGSTKTITTDDQGRFKIELAPGTYSLRTEKTGMRGRGCGVKDIEVSAGKFKQVELKCDTGMR
jgi:hypothetical protein